MKSDKIDLRCCLVYNWGRKSNLFGLVYLLLRVYVVIDEGYWLFMIIIWISNSIIIVIDINLFGFGEGRVSVDIVYVLICLIIYFF